MFEKIAWLYNPAAGLGQFPDNLDHIIDLCQKVGLLPTFFRLSREIEDLDQLFATYDFSEFHSLVVAGGDGTVHTVVNAMMRWGIKVPLAVYPVGTCNDFANYLNIPSDFSEFIEMLVDGRCSPIDLGKIGDQFFINVASAGAITETAHEVDQGLKNAIGRTAYYLKGLEKMIKLRTFNMEISLDGEQQEVEILFFAVLNGTMAGGFRLLPTLEALSDDYLEVIAFKPKILQSIIPLMLQLNREKSILDNPAVFYGRAKKIEIKLDQATPTDLDGEPGPPLPWKIEIVPQALPVRLPIQ